MEGIKTCPVCKKQDDHCLCFRKKQCTPYLTKGDEVSPIGCSKGRALVIGSVDSLPANKAIPEAVNIPESKNLETEKEVLTFNNQSCMQRKEYLASEYSRIMSFNALDNCLERFGNLITRRGREIYTQRTKMDPKEFNEGLIMMVTDEDDFLHEIKIKCSVSSHVTNFRNSKQYFLKIHERVRGGEKVFVVHKIGQKLVYGKVGKDDFFCSYLLFHSLTLTEDPTDSFLMLFDDLKQFSDPIHFYSFIKVTINENPTRVIVIKMLKKQNNHQFVKLCTGEDGPTYKGASITLESNIYLSSLPKVVNVPHFMENGCEVSKPVDFNDKSTNLVRCEADEMYLSFQSETGGFHIFNVNKTKCFKNVIGKVITPTDMWHSFTDADPSNLKIVDCGIALDI